MAAGLAITPLVSDPGAATAGISAAPKPHKGMNLASAKKAATDFEAFFATQMLNSMFAGVKANSVFGGGHGEEMFQSIMMDNYGKEIAKQGKLGIADSVMKSLLQTQEVKS